MTSPVPSTGSGTDSSASGEPNSFRIAAFNWPAPLASLKARVTRSAVGARRRLQQIEADPDRGEPHRLAANVAEPLLARDRRPSAARAGEMDEADGLRRR